MWSKQATYQLLMTTTTLVQWPFSRTVWVNWYQNVSILDLIGDKDDGGGGVNWSYNMSKAPVTNKPTSSFLQLGYPSCHPTNSVNSLKGKYIPWTFNQSLTTESSWSHLEEGPMWAPGL